MSRTEVRRALFNTQHGFCHWCHHPMLLRVGTYATCTIDHLTPRTRGGTNAWSNLVGACRRCNEVKADLTADEFDAWMSVSPLDPPSQARVGRKKYHASRHVARIKGGDVRLVGTGGWTKRLPKIDAAPPSPGFATIGDVMETNHDRRK